MIVADSTILAGYLFATDDFHSIAERVRRKDADWRCPELVFSELRNVGLKQQRKGLSLDSVIARCNLAPAIVSVYRMHSHTVLQTALEGGLSAYDAEYVALARQLDVRLVTKDELILEKFPAIAVSPEEFIKG